MLGLSNICMYNEGGENFKEYTNIIWGKIFEKRFFFWERMYHNKLEIGSNI